MTLSEWKDLEITRVIFTELQNRQRALKEELGQSAGKDPLYDRFRSGYIAACEDFFNIELDDEETQ